MPNFPEKRIDFNAALAGRISQLTEQDNPQRKTNVHPAGQGAGRQILARPTRNVSYRRCWPKS